MRASDERGIALITVMMGILSVTLFAVVMLEVAVSQYEESQYQRRDDTVVAWVDAVLDRYAAKLTIDPAYHYHWVDEAEEARVCTEAGHANYGLVKEPGTAWWPDCVTWTYQNPDPDDWFVHPFVDGSGADAEIEALVHVTPPGAGESVTLEVVSRQGVRAQLRAVRGEIVAQALSEYFRVTEEDLVYGSGATITGKLYSGGDLDFATPVGTVYDDYYAEGSIGTRSGGYGSPNPADGAQGWDGDPGTAAFPDIRQVFPQPLDFNNFWDDLDVLESAACNGGICLDRADVADKGAYLIHPNVVSNEGKVDVWYFTGSVIPDASDEYGGGPGCVDAEEWWWLNGDLPDGSLSRTDPQVTLDWTYLAQYDVPANGAVWANAHVIVGDGNPATAEVLKGGLSVYAGSSTDPKNVILTEDTTYSDSNPDSVDVMGLIASDEIIIDPFGVGADDVFNMNAALLGQADRWRVARSCGGLEAGSNVLTNPSGGQPTLNTSGGISTRATGDIAAHFPTRNYGFDPRFEYLRPPFYPLVVDEWDYADWEETRVPTWSDDNP